VRGDQSGMTLMELMMALMITAITMVIIYGTFVRLQHGATRVMKQVDERQGARAAIQLMERDIRMAGSGWGRLQVHGAYGGAPLDKYAINPGYGGAQSDSISVLGGWDVSTTLTSPMATSTSTITVSSVDGFSANDLIVVTNGTSAHLFQVTSVNPGQKQLNHHTGSTFNASGGHTDWPSSGYLTGSMVYRAAWVSYRVDSTLYRRPSLIRYEVGKTPQLVASDVKLFRVWYRLNDGTTARDTIDVQEINQIVPSIQPNVVSAKNGQDSLWAAIEPRTF
jgi:prepilin-type N-terminal cleavage/methylation domain-containing protein